jgi:hypothetical protein
MKPKFKLSKHQASLVHCLPQPLRNRCSPHSLGSHLVTLKLVALMGLTGGVWCITTIPLAQVAHAETTNMLIPLNREPGETYDTLIRRAEATARVLTQRSFNNPALTDVSITITAEREGLIAPLLRLTVNRQQWRSRPEAQYWTTYFETSRALLGLDSGGDGDALPLPSGAASPISGQTPTTPAPSPLPSTVPGDTIPNSPTPVQLDLPAAPSGQLGLPRS